MPKYLVDLVILALNTSKKSLNWGKILVTGLANKPDVDDMWEPNTATIFGLLKKRGAKSPYYDSFIPEVLFIRDHLEWVGTKSVLWNKHSVSSFDAVVNATNHSANYTELADWSKCSGYKECDE